MASSQTFTLNIKALFDASDVKAKVGDIQSAFKNIKLPDDLRKGLDDNLRSLNKALNDFETRAAKGVSTKADAKGITTSIDNVLKEFSKVENVVGKIKSEFNTTTDLSKLVQLDDTTIQKISTLKNEIKELQNQIADVTSGKLDQVSKELDKIKSKGAKSGAEASIKLFNEGNIDAAIQKLKEVKERQDQLLNSTKKDAEGNVIGYSYNEATRNTAAANIQAIEQLMSIFQQAQSEVGGITSEINSKVAEIGNTAQQASSETINGATQAANALLQEGTAAESARNSIVDLANGQAQFVREVDQVKSRIQYFFGLNNAINLVKRAIRGAVDTIKDLDKAMTATAVVTDFTVKDMWEQLPQYTKRANELGVTTQAAYEAATLYYQQGLNNDEVNALSVETLKMARIAGLDAAEATDRMTNALRGFNMALDEQSAQRVDDVYSELAANTASNVDEISTAMTKVASLAHSANMEFETTAAFLAQIIETTRESAETAGTALKTVVARFSEVKKLVDTNQLKGQDEEGQTVDVNKVSAALRTAGIDLNKYFLGEVGLDDIFMELASKWDSLTSVQQRYIATQAAGSRQQSRFIALMQDYARTQELVGKAYNAEGASARQFEKTQDSLESKLNRLKNAWNEFLMGLTNSAVVKGFVDILTNLLNLVNNLTSAFGDGVGSILKWVAALSALSGLRMIFADGGIGTRVIGSLMGKGIGANKLRASMGLGAFDAATQQYTAYSAEQLRANRGTTLIGGIGGIGKALWGGAQKLGQGVAKTGLGSNLAFLAGAGKLNIGTGAVELGATAAGLTGIATALAAIGVAVGAGVAAYKLWLKLTPEGQLKTAKKQAESLKKDAEEAQKELDNLNSLQDTYKEKSEQITKATTAQDRAAAVAERSQAIMDAISTDGTLAQYVITESVDNEIVLTIDEAALQSAIDNVAKTAREAQIASEFADATVSLREAAVLEHKLDSQIQMGNMAYNREVDVSTLTLEQKVEILADEFTDPRNVAEVYEDYNKIISSRAVAAQSAKIAYGQQLQGMGISDQLINQLLPVLSDAFKQSQKQLTTDELKDILGLGKGLDSILEAYAGEGKLAEISLEGIDLDGDELFTALGLSVDELEEFEKYLKLDNGELKTHIKTQAKYTKEVRRNQQANIFEQALRSGRSINTDFVKTIKGLDFSSLASISDIVGQAAGKISNEAMASLLDTLPNLTTQSLSQLQEFFNSFNLDNPIQALDQLNKKINDVGTTPVFKNLLNDIKSTNSALFESSNLVQHFLLSSSYESLGDSIEDFRKENKKLTAKNINDMAESCEDLQKLLENTEVTAQGLAETFNLFEDGALAIDSVTNSLLAALSAGESFESLISNVQQWIEDFDKGTDLTEGTEHIVSVLKEAGEYVGKWQFGNEPLANIYDHIFGKGAYDAYMKQAWGKKSFEQIEKELSGDINRITSMAENEGLGALQQLTGKLKGLTALNADKTEFKWDLSGFASTEEAIKAVAQGLGVADDAARAFIEGWASHMYDLRVEWNELNFSDTIKAFTDDLGKSRIVTQQELDAMAAATGKEAKDIEKAINDVRKAAGEPVIITVNWQDEKGGALTGKELIDEVNKTLKSASLDYSSLVDQFAKEIPDKIGRAIPLDKTIDFSQLNQYLTESLKLTQSQANEVANDIAAQTGKHFSQEVQVPIKADDGTIEMQAKTITATTAEGLQAGIDAAMEAANVQLVAEEIANLDVTSIGDNLSAALAQGGASGASSVQSSLNSISVNTINVPVDWYWVNGAPSGGAQAAGGVVRSYASGTNHIAPGVSLTGEEGPELVWNKNKGYAYLTGEKNPEFRNLQPGDRIFNAQETKKILRGSLAKGGLIDSYASGGWKPAADKKASGGGGGGGGSDKEKTPEEWKNELDWLYNLMEDIAELERDQKAIEEQYEDYLKDQSKTGKDLYNLLIKQLGNLYTQLNHQTFALEKREQEMREFMDTTNDKDEYLWYNWNDRTIEIDWDAIDKIEDEEEYKHVKELVDEAESIQDKMDDAEDAIMDIQNQIQELENIWRDTFVDFEKRVYDAVVKSYQTVIDNYSELNDTLNNSNSQILDSLQKQISLQRQIRDNTKTEEEISDDEAKLAYLRRDTTGGNDLAALQLQKELDEQRQNYEDTLVDQAISRLQEDNDAAAQQRQQQIDIMQAQLDYQSQNGEFNEYVRELLTSAMGADGELLTNSDLMTLLKEQDNWSAMSDVSQEIWEEELNGTFKEVAAFLLKQNAEQNGTFYTALTDAVKGVSTAIGSYSQAMTKLGNQVVSAASGGGGGGSSSGGSSSGSTNSSTVPAPSKTNGIGTTSWQGSLKATAQAAEIASRGYGTIAEYTNQLRNKGYKYATGGLATSTGLAWLDGTPSEPEYVLNARQTDAFLKLADVLPQMMNSSAGASTTTFGGTTINLAVNLDSVNPDYDVDRMVDLLKDKLYDSGSYRNVNSLSFLR